MKRCFLVIICIFIWSCSSARIESEPHIEFTILPFTHEGGTVRMEPLEGRVIGAKAGQRIVLYTRSGDWFVQPFADQPFTDIRSDMTWRSTVHLGTDFAALLVEPGYTPAARSTSLPAVGDGILAIAVTRARPFFWQTWWFQSVIAVIVLFALIALFRMRMNQLAAQANIRFEERLAERMRIAQDLHDTLLQGFVGASLQLHVAVEELPDEMPAKEKLVHIQGLMSKVIAEGRDAVQGLRSSADDTVDPVSEFSRLACDLDDGQQVNFRVILEGKPESVRPSIWIEAFNICREALTNAYRHSEASTIEVEIEYSAGFLKILVRDNGRGIEPEILSSGREEHWGLSGMRERSENIDANLRVLSRAGAGTEVSLSIPGHIAFETGRPRGSFGWLTGIRSRELNGRSQKGPDNDD